MISAHHIFKDILTQRTRVLLTILAIAWGTASITGMLAVGEGLRITFGNAMSSAGKGLLIVYPGQTSQSYRGVGKGQPIKLTPRDLQRIKQTVTSIGSIVGEYQFSANIYYHDNHTKLVSPRGVSPQYGSLRNIQIAKGGRFINRFDMKNYQRVIVLGNKIAKNLFKKGENPIGKSVLLGEWPFRVVGVMKKKVQFYSFSTPDAYQVWIPATTFQSLTQVTNYSDIVVQPKNPKHAKQIEQQIRRVIANDQGVNPNDKQILHFNNTYEVQKKTNALFLGMQIFLGIVGGITLLVAGIGIANVMYISVNRSTREIGIRMAIGARSYHVLSHYLLEALITTSLGGLLGILVAEGIITAINHIPIHSDFFSSIGKPHPILSYSVVITVILVLGLIGFFSGLFPARKAANIDPAVALRHE